MRKAYYLIVSGQLATAHETLEEAQGALYQFIQSTPNVEAFVCEVLPRIVGKQILGLEYLS